MLREERSGRISTKMRVGGAMPAETSVAYRSELK